MIQFVKLLSGSEPRSAGRSNDAVLKVRNDDDFDELFKCLSYKDRMVRMRAADAIEKITLKYPSYLFKHKSDLMDLCCTVKEKRLKGHFALLVPRLNLTANEKEIVWQRLTGWALDREESKRVRINSIQALYEIAEGDNFYIKDFELAIDQVEKENITSLNARIKRLTHHAPL
ncbi:MAG: hypothetical protein ABI288_07330 [Ginsengibacter sp.]